MRQKGFWQWYRQRPFSENLRKEAWSGNLVQKHLVALDPDTAKRRTEAQAWLRKRAQAMIALGNGTYVDRSLVTCAEYQLFLDAQQFQGRFCQPDHWKTGTIVEDQGNNAVLGVRASDARAFCQWLTEQDTEGWRYRLPVLDEWDELEGSEASISESLPPGSGCWIALEVEPGTTWKGRCLLFPETVSSMIQTFIADDWSRQPAELAEFALPLRLAHQLTRLLSCELEQDIHSHLALAHERFQGCDLEQCFALAHSWANILQQMQILAMAHTSDLLRALIGDLKGRATADESNKMFLHLRDLTSLLVTSGDVSRDLLSLLEQALDRSGRNAAFSLRGEEVFYQADRKTLLFASLRSSTLHLACFLGKLEHSLFSEEVAGWFQLFLWGKDYADLDKGAFEQTIVGYLGLYLRLVFLELRCQGQVPAWEGILLVKERKGVNS
jgi:hypothetical protein